MHALGERGGLDRPAAGAVGLAGAHNSDTVEQRHGRTGLDFAGEGRRCGLGDIVGRRGSTIGCVGQVWRGGDKGEPEKLVLCYRRSLEIAAEQGLKTIAFPCISTGIFGYPPEKAAKIAMETVQSFGGEFDEVSFCCYLASDLAIYQSLLP